MKGVTKRAVGVRDGNVKTLQKELGGGMIRLDLIKSWVEMTRDGLVGMT